MRGGWIKLPLSITRLVGYFSYKFKWNNKDYQIWQNKLK